MAHFEYPYLIVLHPTMMVVNAFLCVFLNTIWLFSWSCLENQVSGAWISVSAYGIGRALLEKRRRGASQ